MTWYQLHSILVTIDYLAHSVGYAALVKSLISVDLISIFVSDSDQQQASLSTIDRYLPDEFIKALLEQLLSDGTDANVPCLPLFQSLVQFNLQLNHFCSGCRCRQHCLDPQLSIFHYEFLRRQYGSENVFSLVCLVVLLFFLLLFGILLPYVISSLPATLTNTGVENLTRELA